MRRLAHVSLILGMAVFMAADDVKKENDSDYDRIQGVWVVREAWEDGKKVAPEPGENDEAFRFVNRKAEMGELVRGKFVDSELWNTVLVLDESKSPKHITLVLEVKGIMEGVAIRCVYSLEGDTLRICAAEYFSEKRPKALPEKGKKGGGLLVLTLTRVQPKKP